MTDVVLDASAFDHLGRTAVHALMRRTVERGGRVRTTAVTLAEVCRGSARTRQVESAVARVGGGQRVAVLETDLRLAKLVGAILHQTGSDSSMIADAHVIACCTQADHAIVLTADADDLTVLRSAVPGTRITLHRPDHLA